MIGVDVCFSSFRESFRLRVDRRSRSELHSVGKRGFIALRGEIVKQSYTIANTTAMFGNTVEVD